MHWTLRSVYSGVMALLLHLSVHVEAGIGCFKCSSINGSVPGCRDPFHPAMGDFYHRFCRQTVTHRVGQFPAKYCTKIKGINTRTKAELLVRSCDMESGFDNTCGTFIFEGDEYHGCLMSCKSHACNSAVSSFSAGGCGWSRWWSSYGRSLVVLWIVSIFSGIIL
ncbi:uncharacterized protein [Littorina saxatilis]|uniref:Protein quiver n=1 Tax=Littorina saxatilis TaxID=31220 RepID=A0AAN9BBJ2_9CAEN